MLKENSLRARGPATTRTEMVDSSLIAAVDATTADFKKNLFAIASLLMASLSLVAGLLFILAEHNVQSGGTALLFTVPSVATLISTWRGRVDLAAKIFIIGVTSVMTVSLFVNGTSNANTAVTAYCLLMMLAGFTISPVASIAVAGIGVATLIGFDRYLGTSATENGGSFDLASQVALLILFAVLGWVLAKHSHFLNGTLRHRLLGIETTTPSLGDAARRLAAAAEEIHVMTNQQREGAFRQSSAVKETREALKSTLEASAEIAKSARAVYENAEETTRNGERAADRVAVLAEQAHRIAQILETIREISTKSELLALNASLESTKAGEAGRGFSLVAKEMQQLAERVMGSVKDIKALTKEIRESTQGVQLSMEETIKLARATTEAGREISFVTQQQQSSTEQVTCAMDDISEITSQAAVSAEQTMLSTEDLKNVATELPILISRLTEDQTS